MRPRSRSPFVSAVAAFILAATSLAGPGAKAARGVEIQAEILDAGVWLRVPGIYWEFSVERAGAPEGDFTYLGYRYIGCTEACEYLDAGIEEGATYWYRLRLTDRDGEVITLGPAPVAVPIDPRGVLRAVASPNPFTERVSLDFRVPPSLAASGSVPALVTIHDPAGRLVRSLSLGDLAGGDQTWSWDGRNGGGGSLANGVYFARLQVGGVEQIVRLLKLR
jgi:hypothetical protein